MRTDLILAKAFCQVDTVHGFRYLDDAGKLMNEYVDRYPEMAVGLNGLSMKNGSLPIDEIRVSNTSIWLSFNKPDTRQYVQDQAFKIIPSIAAVINVTTAKRFGLRVHEIVPLDGPKSLASALIPGVLPAWFVPPDAEPSHFDLSVRVKIGNLEATIRAVPVVRAPDATVAWMPDHALLVDVDVSESAEALNIRDLRPFLVSAVGVAEGAVKSIAANFGGRADAPAR
jgi:hypothetical protein